MKILHCCLSCFYIDNYNYQENMLVREHVQAGHEVLVIASTESYDEKGLLYYKEPGEYIGNDGAMVIRLPYRKFAPHFIMRKIRSYPNIYKLIKNFAPDIILFHGCSAWELQTIVQYKKKNPTIKLYLDSHEDFNNSALSFFSKYILHKLLYRSIFKKALPYVEKVLCISIETMDFIINFYHCPKEKTEYYPLGGKIIGNTSYNFFRNSLREKYKIKHNDLVFFQSGKFDKKKKLPEALLAFLALPYKENIKYLIAGVLQDEIKPEVEKLIAQDKRFMYLGWQSAEDMIKLLCTTDVYVQPGSQSATLQNSICCRCVVIVDKVPSHEPFVKNNGWYVTNQKDLENALSKSINAFENGQLEIMKQNSLKIAKELLDYEILAKRILR